MFRGFRRHHLRGGLAADGVRNLAVGRSEVLMPEQRHLLLQGAPRVQHAEQPPLTRVVDGRRRRKRLHHPGRWRHGRIPALTNELINIVGRAVKLYERIQRGGKTPLSEHRRFGGCRTKTGAAQEVLNPRIG
jgi:hypothetical protein